MDAKTLSDLTKKYPVSAYGDDGITCMVFGRLQFVHLDQPRKSEDPTAKPRYDTAIILPLDADVSALDAAMRKAWTESPISKTRGKPKSKALKEQSELAGQNFAGFSDRGWFVNAGTTRIPEIFNPDMSKAPTDKPYPGCHCRVKVRAYAYEIKGNWGVGFSLEGVQFLADDDKLYAGGNASDGFEAHAPAGSKPAAMPNGAAGGVDSAW